MCPKSARTARRRLDCAVCSSRLPLTFYSCPICGVPLFDSITGTVAVVDTCVSIDLQSIHDLVKALGPEWDWNGAAVLPRARRLREATQLALFFQQIQATTYGSNSEYARKMTELASPSDDPTQLWRAFTGFYLLFAEPHLLSGWRAIVPTDPEPQVGSEMDRLLVDKARATGLPLISHEGYLPDGTVVTKARSIRVRARDAGVRVFTAIEFMQKYDFDRKRASLAFLDRFESRARYYVAHQGRLENASPSASAALLRALKGLQALYRRVLLDEKLEIP